MKTQASFIATLRHSWKEDVLASVVVFLVALPLSLGIAIASGVPIDKAASVGLITAIIGGLVVGPLSGSPLQVSGPAAGLAVMVALFIQEHGFETLGTHRLAGRPDAIGDRPAAPGSSVPRRFARPDPGDAGGNRNPDLRLAIPRHGGRSAAGHRQGIRRRHQSLVAAASCMERRYGTGPSSPRR